MQLNLNHFEHNVTLCELVSSLSSSLVTSLFVCLFVCLFVSFTTSSAPIKSKCLKNLNWPDVCFAFWSHVFMFICCSPAASWGCTISLTAGAGWATSPATWRGTSPPWCTWSPPPPRSASLLGGTTQDYAGLRGTRGRDWDLITSQTR